MHNLPSGGTSCFYHLFKPRHPANGTILAIASRPLPPLLCGRTVFPFFTHANHAPLEANGAVKLASDESSTLRLLSQIACLPTVATRGHAVLWANALLNLFLKKWKAARKASQIFPNMPRTFTPNCHYDNLLAWWHTAGPKTSALASKTMAG